ncbi:Bgt-20390 [Blumeria graminis f. sp. tritici]|uniref:Bgt-20390 n=2 Tax=Blumeria graminis f. sp. tritici TaxID=62690 RepID=A0A9X9MFV8_BLUGR|nr:Bgt-20390 [Blumeria graminis f. sp. tritici]
MCEIGGRDPTISEDALVSAQFFLSPPNSQKFSSPFTISAGVVPDGTFPGDLTLGQTVFHAFGFEFLAHGEIKLLEFPEIPVLNPLIENNLSQKIFTTKEIYKIKWHPNTTIQGVKYGQIYAEKFPSLFDKYLRRSDILSKTSDRIDTNNSPPIKLPPRCYSPSQIQANRDFRTSHEGTLIKKCKGLWAAPLLLTQK